MKILFINKDDNRGGAAGVAWNLAKELRLLGHEVRFLVRRKFSDDDNVMELAENPLLYQMRKIFHRDFTVVLTNWRDQLLANDIDYGESAQILNHPWLEWADVIHCHNLHGNYFRLDNLIDLTARKPLIWTLHDLWAVTGHSATLNSSLDAYQKILWDNTKYLLRRKTCIYNLSTFSVTVSSLWMADRISHSVLKNKPLTLIPNGINFNIFKKSNRKLPLRTKYNIPIDKPVVAYFPYGKNNFDKGWRYIADLMNKRTDLHFLKVENIYDQNVLVDYYHLADVLLFPSLAESFGMVPLEAIACGLPVVAFPVGVIPEIINHKKNGYIARYKDAKDLETGLDYVIKHVKGTGTLNKKFDIKSVARKFSDLYERTQQS